MLEHSLINTGGMPETQSSEDWFSSGINVSQGRSNHSV